MSQGFIERGWALTKSKDAKRRDSVTLSIVSTDGDFSAIELKRANGIELARELLRALGVPQR